MIGCKEKVKLFSDYFGAGGWRGEAEEDGWGGVGGVPLLSASSMAVGSQSARRRAREWLRELSITRTSSLQAEAPERLSYCVERFDGGTLPRVDHCAATPHARSLARSLHHARLECLAEIRTRT